TLKRLGDRLREVREATGVRRVFLFDAERTSLVDTDADVRFGDKLYALEADRFEVTKVFEERRAATSVFFADTDGVRYKFAYVPIFLDAERTEVAAAVGVEASASYFALLTNFASGLLALGLLGVGALGGMTILLSRSITRPVGELVTAARRLGMGDLKTPVVPAEDMARDQIPNDELEFLARAFEEMRQGVMRRDQQMQMMLSGIAHEVRNPLGGMELFCGLLHEDLEALEVPERPELLDKVEKVQRELVYLSKVVHDFLDFARHRPLETERVLGKELADELAMLLSGQVGGAGCELRVEVEPEDVELTVDRERLRRAIINTIRNAYQAAGAGCVTLVMREDGARRIIEVRDEGPGISEKKLEEILTPFFTTKEKGSGLGLPLTRKIIEQHGGQLTIDSVVGQGTTVRFDLPFDEEIEVAAFSPGIPEGWLG
ncbi:MAG: HAMP domain-containing sensor histidine kinase, partial [Myxococcota bacterium]